MRGVKENKSRTGAAMLPVQSSTTETAVSTAGKETTVQMWHFSPDRSVSPGASSCVAALANAGSAA